MNLWRAFQKTVMSGGPTYVGEVVSVESAFGDQRCTVQLLPGEALMQVKGPGRSLEIGQRWIVRDGAIVEEGPKGAVLTIEV